jgi:hypothetical protein
MIILSYGMAHTKIFPYRLESITGKFWYNITLTSWGQGQLIGLGVEEQILGVLGQHRWIIGFLGKHEKGFLLEHMPNGSVADYLHNADPQPPI